MSVNMNSGLLKGYLEFSVKGSTLAMNDIMEQILDSIYKIIDVDENITPNSNLFDEYNMGSLDVVDLIIHLEEIFGIEFIDDDLVLDNFQSINKISALVELRNEKYG